MNRDIQFTGSLFGKPNPDPPLAQPRDRSYVRLSLFQLARAFGWRAGEQVERVRRFRPRRFAPPPVGKVDVTSDGRRLLPVPQRIARAMKARG